MYNILNSHIITQCSNPFITFLTRKICGKCCQCRIFPTGRRPRPFSSHSIPSKSRASQCSGGTRDVIGHTAAQRESKRVLEGYANVHVVVDGTMYTYIYKYTAYMRIFVSVSAQYVRSQCRFVKSVIEEIIIRVDFT